MGLREDYEKILRQQQTEAVERQQQQTEEDICRRLYEEVWGVEYAKHKITQNTLFNVPGKYFIEQDVHELCTFRSLYKRTLPVKLSLDYQQIVSDFVDLYRNWSSAPIQVDETLITDYSDAYSFSKVRFSDGSIHIDESGLENCLNDGRYTDLQTKVFLSDPLLTISEFVSTRKFNKRRQEERRAILASARDRVARRQQFQYGSQEYARFEYYWQKWDSRESAWLVIFRDKTVFDLGGGREKGRGPLQSREYFHQFCLKQLPRIPASNSINNV